MVDISGSNFRSKMLICLGKNLCFHGDGTGIMVNDYTISSGKPVVKRQVHGGLTEQSHRNVTRCLDVWENQQSRNPKMK